MTAASSASRRLVYVVNNAAFFTSHRLPIGLGAIAAGYDVHVACPASPALDALAEHGFTVHPIAIERQRHTPLSETRAVGSLVALYRRLRPQLVHHVTVKPVLYGTLAARLTRVPAVVNAISGLGYMFETGSAMSRLRRAAAVGAYRLLLGHPSMRVIFQNDDDAAVLIGARVVAPEDAVMIRGSGVDLAGVRGTAEPELPHLVILASRMLWAKGVGEFVAAARELRASGLDARFALVGDTDPGNPGGVPRDVLTAWDAEGVVEWWGHRSDMPDVLAASHVVCLPSYYREGVPKVLLEAAAAGRPVVTTDRPGCRDAVEHGVTGLLVPPRDARALAGAVRRLLSDADLRRDMGDNARRRAETLFDVRAVVRSTLDVYDELLAGMPAGAGAPAAA